MSKQTLDEVDEVFEYFVQEYDTAFKKIHDRYLAGEISIEDQVFESGKVWNKQLKIAKAQIKKWVEEEIIRSAETIRYEDDTTYGDTQFRHQDVIWGQNELRKEQKEKLKNA